MKKQQSDEERLEEFRRSQGFPAHVEVPEGGPKVSTPDYPDPLRHSLRDADADDLTRNKWPRKN
jgi:hypothetical protein